MEGGGEVSRGEECGGNDTGAGCCIVECLCACVCVSARECVCFGGL